MGDKYIVIIIEIHQEFVSAFLLVCVSRLESLLVVFYDSSISVVAFDLLRYPKVLFESAFVILSGISFPIKSPNCPF